MRESARRGAVVHRQHAEMLGIDPRMIRHNGVHIHVPAGAVPKDGPSAGVAHGVGPGVGLHRHAGRSDTAMTGEITLSGLVLPVGGIKEKVLAARRAGMRRVVLPRDNEEDLRELPDNVRQEMQVILAERIEEVLEAALPGLVRTVAVDPLRDTSGERGLKALV